MGEGVVGGREGGGGGEGINRPAILNPFSTMCFIDHDVGYKFLFQVISMYVVR